MSTEESILFKGFDLNGIQLKNRAVMAPMTRCRATSTHVPTAIMATYYEQRAGAGLIISEGTSPSPNGSGYARIPGIYTKEQIEAWKPITEAVHRQDSKIFLQIMHTGRVSHPLNMDEGAQVLSSSATEATNTQMYTDQEGMQALPAPKEMSQQDIDDAIEEYVNAAQNAIEAGFDGIELHGANGYLLEQFINPSCNQREDQYGGNAENRSRFVLEVANSVVDAIGKERVGIRLSPHGAFNDINPFENEKETFEFLAKRLKEIGISYIHLVDHSAMGAPIVPPGLTELIRDHFSGTIIRSGGYDFEKAEKDLTSGLGELIAFGRPFISNPDLLNRFKLGVAIANPNFDTFYTPGEEGYIDYPTF